MVNTDLVNRIINLRESKNLSQMDLGRLIGLDKSTMSKIENNTRNIKTDELKILSEVFEVSVDYLLNGTNNFNTTEYPNEKNIDTVIFSNLLKALRKKEKHLTQLDMAKYLNIAKTTYASYEQGKRMPDINIQKQLADYFGVTLDYLHGMDSKNVKLTSNQLKILSHIDDCITEEQVKEISNFIEFVKQKNTNVN